MKHDVQIVREVSMLVSNHIYRDNLQATDQLMCVIDKNCKPVPAEVSDYCDFYDTYCYTYRTFKELVKSEKEQGNYGLTEVECKEQIGKTIFQLFCGWYVQIV